MTIYVLHLRLDIFGMMIFCSQIDRCSCILKLKKVMDMFMLNKTQLIKRSNTSILCSSVLPLMTKNDKHAKYKL